VEEGIFRPFFSTARKDAMNADQLRALQAPLKKQYQEQPASALKTMKVEGRLSAERLACNVQTPRGIIEAGLHPAAGGDGSFACSGDMLLEALVGCAGVTLQAVATALNIPLKGGTIHAEGDLDFRGTLGVSKAVPVGFQDIRLVFDLDTTATPEQVDKLIALTRRFCVIYQTLVKSPKITEELLNR